MKRISTNNAPKAIGTYSQGTIVGNLVFTSGQIAINAKTGKLVNDDFIKEVLQVLKNIESILIAGGSSKSNIIKLSVFMIDLTKFDKVNKAFEIFFDSNTNFPSRSTIEVSKLPMNVNIEIEAIGLI